MEDIRPLTGQKRIQVSVCCNLCDAKEIKWKCIDCDILICTKCRNEKHPFDHFSVDIRLIGSLKKANSQNYSDFPVTECSQHGEKVSSFCRTCKKLLCLKCIEENLNANHKRHSIIQKEEYNRKLDIMIYQKDRAFKNLKYIKEAKEEIYQKRKVETSNYYKMRKEILARKKAAKIKSIINTDSFKAELNFINYKWKNVIKAFREKQKMIEEDRKLLHRLNMKFENLIKSTDFATFLEDAEKMDILTQQESYKNLVKKCELKHHQNFSSIPKCEIGSAEFIVAKQFTTDLANIHYISSDSYDLLWIGDNTSAMLQKVKIDEQNILVESKYDIRIFGIASFSTGNLLICPYESSLMQISRNLGKIGNSKYRVRNLHVRAVHVTKDNRKVIVGARDNKGSVFPAYGNRVVIVMDRKGKHLAVHESDNEKNLFTYPRSITSTSNGNIFVIDQLSKDDTGRVVVLSEDGNKQSIYTGHPSNKVNFTPVGIATTPKDKILVTDGNNHALHVLDCNGCFLVYIDTRDLGIIYPYSLAFTSSQKLLIGSVHGKENPGKGKLFEVVYCGI